MSVELNPSIHPSPRRNIVLTILFGILSHSFMRSRSIRFCVYRPQTQRWISHASSSSQFFLCVCASVHSDTDVIWEHGDDDDVLQSIYLSTGSFFCCTAHTQRARECAPVLRLDFRSPRLPNHQLFGALDLYSWDTREGGGGGGRGLEGRMNHNRATGNGLRERNTPKHTRHEILDARTRIELTWRPAIAPCAF